MPTSFLARTILPSSPPQSRLSHYLIPFRILLFAVLHLPTSYLSYLRRAPSPRTSFSDHLFFATWNSLSPPSSVDPAAIHPQKRALLSNLHGVVLELGPGNNTSVEPSEISHLYLLEPNPLFCRQLSERLSADIKWEGKYTIINSSIEDTQALLKAGVPEEVDFVLSFLVLCSVKDLEETVGRIWERLRCDGELLVWEHVKSDDSATELVQWIYDSLWWKVMGCGLRRKTIQAVSGGKRCGWDGKVGWALVEAGLVEGEGRWCVIPTWWGRFVKG